MAIGLGLGLATNRWSDRPRVTFVGFADDLSALAPDSIRHYDDLAAVFEIVDAARRRQHSACAAGGFDSVRAARLVDNDARMWAPEFVVLSGVPSDPDVQRLQELTRDPRNAIGVIVVGDVPAAPGAPCHSRPTDGCGAGRWGSTWPRTASPLTPTAMR